MMQYDVTKHQNQLIQFNTRLEAAIFLPCYKAIVTCVHCEYLYAVYCVNSLHFITCRYYRLYYLNMYEFIHSTIHRRL